MRLHPVTNAALEIVSGEVGLYGGIAPKHAVVDPKCEPEIKQMNNIAGALVLGAQKKFENATSTLVLNMMVTVCGDFGVLGVLVLRAVVEDISQGQDIS